MVPSEMMKFGGLEHDSHVFWAALSDAFADRRTGARQHIGR